MTMVDPEINECLRLMDASSGAPASKACSVYVKYKPIKYYEAQRREAIEYLKQEAGKVTAKKLVVPQDEFVGWMRNGCIDFDTYIILRNYVLKKSYQKRMALRKELETAKKMLSHVGTATSHLIKKVDVKDFAVKAPPTPQAAPPIKSHRPIELSIAKSEMLVVKKCKADEPSALPPIKQAICGLMFGLLAAKVVCTFLIRLLPPKLVDPGTIT